MKALVAYYSQTGNTEKLARKIYDTLDVDKKIEPMSENPQADEYDIIFVGFPVMVHSVPVPVQNFIKSLPKGKKIAIFSTHGSLRGGPLAVTAMEHAVSLAAGAKGPRSVRLSWKSEVGSHRGAAEATGKQSMG